MLELATFPIMADLPHITGVHCVYSSCWDASSNEVLPVVRANVAFSFLMTAANSGVPSVIQIMGAYKDANCVTGKQ